MSTLTKIFGAASPSYNTSWSREIIFQSFSDLPIGKISKINLNFTYRHSTANASTTAHIIIFSGLKKDWSISGWSSRPASAWWETRNGTHEYAYAPESINGGDVPGGYQYKQETSSKFYTTILAEGDFTLTRGTETQVNTTVSFSGVQLKQTNLQNWNNVLYFAIYSKEDTGNTKWLWASNFSPQITFEYSQESSGVLNSSSVELGKTSSITINGDNSYSHKIIWSCGSNTQTNSIAAGVKTSSYTIPAGWGSNFPSSSSFSGSVTLETYSGSTKIGSKVYSLTYTVPNYSPTISSCSITNYIHDISYDSIRYFSGFSNQNFLTDKTSATFTINASSSYGATISSYITRQTNSSGSVVSSAHTFSFKGNIPCTNFYVIVTDSRGKTATTEISLNKKTYNQPNITKIETYRCSSSGEKDEFSGAYCKISVTYTSGTSSINGNSNTTSISINVNGNNYNNNAVIPLSLDSTGNYTITLTDTAKSKIIRTGTISSVKYLMHFRKNIQSMGIGCAAPSTNNQLNIAWETKFTENGYLYNAPVRNLILPKATWKNGEKNNETFDIVFERPDDGTYEGRIDMCDESYRFYAYHKDTPSSSPHFIMSLNIPNKRLSVGELTLTTALSASYGGTGYTSLQATRNAMGLGNTTGALPIENGGTGATNAANALANLGTKKILYGSSTSSVTVENGAILLVPIS